MLSQFFLIESPYIAQASLHDPLASAVSIGVCATTANIISVSSVAKLELGKVL